MILLRAILLSLLLVVAVPAQVAWTEVSRRLPEVWKVHYPVSDVQFEPQAGRGVLRVQHGGRVAFYYPYFARVPRMGKGESGQLEKKTVRRIELWVRYEPQLKNPYSLHFLREDLLPGSGRVWIRR
ncbi:MAG: hypothetical protein HS115_20285 [Spirochaetales bacterium]|nr:hypothetical protein [Spirochaetales bacterium]